MASHLSPTLSIAHLLQVVEQAPQSLQGSVPFDALCEEAWTKCPEKNRPELETSLRSFKQRFAALADKTRSIVVTSFTSMIDPLMREPLQSLFCEKTRVRPEDCFAGKLILVDLPVHSFQFVGRIANLIWKTAFKRACQQRVQPTIPVFLWIDECQYLLDPSDAAFQTTARSSLCCSVFLTQTISNLVAEFGNSARVDALLSCLHTKVFHQNGDHATNTWASQTIQKMPVRVQSESRPKTFAFLKPDQTSVTESTHWEEDVPGRVFLNLKSGGPENRSQVEGIVFYPGRKFSNGKPWMKAVFDQKKEE